MVALTKRRPVRFLIDAFLLVCLGLVVAECFRLCVHGPPSVQHPIEDEIPGHPTPGKIGWEGSVKINFNVPALRIQELKDILTSIGEAYTNGQFEVARRHLLEVPDDIFTLSADPHDEVFFPLMGIFHGIFMFRHDKGPQARPLRDFVDVAAFTSYMRLNFELARFFNEAEVKVGKPPMAIYDQNILYQLKCYQKKFGVERKVELEHAAKKFYDEWCEQVESKDGYTRRCMWNLMNIYLYTRRHRPDLWKSNREIIQLVREKAVGLVKLAGYKPKWLDDEFPLPPGASDPCDAVCPGQSSGKFN